MKKFFNNPVVQVILLIVVTYFLLYVGSIIGLPIYVITSAIGNDAIAFMGRYATDLGIWIVVFIFWGIVKKYRCLFAALGPEAKGNRFSTALIIGIVLGLGLNLIVALIAMLCGDIQLSFNEINVLYIIGFIIAVGIQSGAEELLYRAHMYQNLRRIFPNYPAAAIAGSALMFSLLHINNSGITLLALLNLFISGLLFALIVYYFDSFWGAVAAHTGWNFCQSILLGLPNSGNVSSYSIFKLDAANAQNSFAYNVGFGIEGTVASTLILAIACVVVIIIGRKRDQKPLDVWALQKPAQINETEASGEK